MRYTLFAFLAFCVLSSKNIIIFNEEILVCCTFFLFMMFTFRYFGKTIQDSLDERGSLIQTELQDFCTLKIESASLLMEEYKSIANLHGSLKRVADFTLATGFGGESSGNASKNLIGQEIQQKLTTLALSKASLQQQLQKSMASALLGTVLVEYHGSKKGTLKTILNKLKTA